MNDRKITGPEGMVKKASLIVDLKAMPGVNGGTEGRDVLSSLIRFSHCLNNCE